MLSKLKLLNPKTLLNVATLPFRAGLFLTGTGLVVVGAMVIVAAAVVNGALIQTEENKNVFETDDTV